MAINKGVDTYAIVAEADAWSVLHPYDGGDWANIEDEQKERLLRYATKFMDYRFSWGGTPTSTQQELAFPRKGLFLPNGSAVDEDSIPDLLRDATCEFARKLAISDITNDQVIEDLKITRAGDISFGPNVKRKVVPAAVRDIIPDSWFSILAVSISVQDRVPVDTTRIFDETTRT